MNGQADSPCLKQVFNAYAASSEVCCCSNCLIKIPKTLFREQKYRMIGSNSPMVNYVNELLENLLLHSFNNVKVAMVRSRASRDSIVPTSLRMTSWSSPPEPSTSQS